MRVYSGFLRETSVILRGGPLSRPDFVLDGPSQRLDERTISRIPDVAMTFSRSHLHYAGPETIHDEEMHTPEDCHDATTLGSEDDSAYTHPPPPSPPLLDGMVDTPSDSDMDDIGNSEDALVANVGMEVDTEAESPNANPHFLHHAQI